MSLALSVLAFAVALGLAFDGRLGGAGGLVAVVAVGASFGLFLAGRRGLGASGRKRADHLARLAFTLGGLTALLRHPIAGPGGPAPLHDALVAHLAEVDPWTFALWGAVAMAIKFIGVVFSALGWHLLLRGQGIGLPFGQTILSGFLIGRFIGTFLPSTLGLDGYTLWEVGRITGAWPRVVTAKLAEKLLGATALFGGILLMLPVAFGVFTQAFGDSSAPWIVAAVGLSSAAVVLTALALFLWPGIWLRLARSAGAVLPSRIAPMVTKVATAASAYKGRAGLLVSVFLCKLLSHFTTAVVYWCTALAIGVVGAAFLPIVAGSLLQILGTLLSPTIGGEGAREALQALLLTPYYDANPAKAVLAAALGFIAAEAATLWGGVFLWTRTERWRPAHLMLDGERVEVPAGRISSAVVLPIEDQDPSGVEARAQGKGGAHGAGLGDPALKGKEVAVERNVEAPDQG